jgi:hypothetical protein
MSYRTKTEDNECDDRGVPEFQPIWVVPTLACCLSALVILLAVFPR